jgi:23S rRNA pseudouridine2605 synthase
MKKKYSDKPQRNTTPTKSNLPNPVEAHPEFPMRLNKYLAHCGIASRRKCADYVKEGGVQVNGKMIDNPGFEVQKEDQVSFQGKVVQLQTKKIYLLMNKPKNTITTLSDEKGRKTVMEIVENRIKERIYPVGRLDRDTTGLLLLTNDGDLATQLSHPSYRIEKIYHATLDKPLKPKDFEAIQKGLELEDGLAPVDALHYHKESVKEIVIKVHIGRNRIVRRIFEHLGYQVTKLDRIYYAGLSKKNLKRGWFRELTQNEIIMLKHFTAKTQ